MDDELRMPPGGGRPGGGAPGGGGGGGGPRPSGGGGGGGGKVGNSKTMIYVVLLVIGYALFHTGVLTPGSNLMTMVAVAALAAIAVSLGHKWLDAGVKRIGPLEVFISGFIFSVVFYVSESFGWTLQLGTVGAALRLIYIAWRSSLKVVDLDMEEVVAGTDLVIVLLWVMSKYPQAGQGVNAVSAIIAAVFGMVHQVTGF